MSLFVLLIQKLENRDLVEQTLDSVALDMPEENLPSVDNKYTLEEYSASPTLPAKRPTTHILVDHTPSNSSTITNTNYPLPNTR